MTGAAKVTLRVLITGFGPFPGIIENASEAFARLFAFCVPEYLPNLQAACAILPTEWEAAPRRLHRLLAELQPHLCLHFGVQGGATGLVLETIARNRAGDRLDAAGQAALSPKLEEDAPHMLLPPSGTMRLLRPAQSAGLPVTASLNAGDYVCNALFFHSLSAARRSSHADGERRQVAFVHLPVRVGGAGRAEDDTLNANDLPLEAALAGALSVLGAMSAQPVSAGPMPRPFRHPCL
jgi:pyroglutamyl-peptidase